MTAIAIHSPVLKVSGTALPDRWLNQLTGLRVELALNLVGRATIRFTDPGYGLSTTNLFALGNDVAISLSNGDALMVGMVTGVSLDQTDSGDPDLVVTVHDSSYRLTRGTTVKTFQQVTYSDVIRKMAQAAGMQSAVTATTATYPYLMQNGSDLDFLNEMTARSGSMWWVIGKKLMVDPLSSPTSTVTVALGEHLTEFSVRASGLRPDKVSVSGWDASTTQLLTSVAAKPATAASDFVGGYTKPQDGLGSAKAAAADRLPTTANEATELATALLRDWADSTVVGQGSGPANAKITPGVAVQVQNAGPTSGTYLVSSVEHSYGRAGLTTRFTTGHNRPIGLVDTLGPSTQSPTGAFAIGGLVIGLVSNINDPDNIGRVRVKYAALADEVESDWARVLTVGGGPSRGVVFQPEINDEVLVAFEHGDPRRPVVLGGLFSRKSVPPWKPESNSSAVNARRLSSRLGHFIELGDGTDPATKHVLLELQSGHKLRLGDDRFDIEMKAGKPLLIKAGTAKIEFDASGNIAIEANAISIKAKQGVTVEGLNVDVKASAQASVQGATVAVKGNGTASVEGGGTLTLKGGMVAIN